MEVDISSGVSISKVGWKDFDRYQYFFVGQIKIDTGNVMIRRDVFEKVGLFDRQLKNKEKEMANLG